MINQVLNITVKLVIINCFLFLFTKCFTHEKEVKRSFYPDGTLQSQMATIDDIPNGLYKHYARNGMDSAYHFLNGVRDGQCTSFYLPSGHVREFSFYVNGKRERKALGYYESGELWYSAKYENDHLNGLAKIFNRDSSIKMLKEYVNDTLTRLTVFQADGEGINTYYTYLQLPDTLAYRDKIRFTLRTYNDMTADSYTCNINCLSRQRYADYQNNLITHLPETFLPYQKGDVLTFHPEARGWNVIFGGLHGWSKEGHAQDVHIFNKEIYVK